MIECIHRASAHPDEFSDERRQPHASGPPSSFFHRRALRGSVRVRCLRRDAGPAHRVRPLPHPAEHRAVLPQQRGGIPRRAQGRRGRPDARRDAGGQRHQRGGPRRGSRGSLRRQPRGGRLPLLSQHARPVEPAQRARRDALPALGRRGRGQRDRGRAARDARSDPRHQGADPGRLPRGGCARQGHLQAL